MCVCFINYCALLLLLQASRWFPQLRVPMEGILGTSVVFRERALAATALFCTDEDEFGCKLEVYPRY